MREILFSTAVLALAVASTTAAGIEYVTDLALYSSLAPCAQYAVRYNIQAQTADACPDAPTELQSCVCTKNNNLASISAQMSKSVSYSCGSTASDDQASASMVLSAYCNPSAVVTFATPTAVTAYITEIPEFDYLAPCAKSALKYAVGSVTYDSCPSDAPNAALASCACFKNQNSRVVSQIINTSAKSSCSGHTADVSSAQAMFAAYCAMNNGTTAFPVPSNPPGDMSYYITDLMQFSSLAPCAASALSYAVQSQTYDLCPGGPQALASCVCLKDGMTSEVLKVITSSVKYSCSSTATEDISSAVAVYNFYCSAAAAQVTAAGVSNSVEQSYPASRASDGAQATGGSGTGTGSGSGNGNGSGDSGSSGGSSTGGNNPSSSSGASTPVIVGAVVGVIGGIALIGALIFFVMKSARKRKATEPLQLSDGSPPGGPVGLFNGNGKQEPGSDAASAPLSPPSPIPSTLAANVPGRIDNVSPASAHASAFTPPPNQAELHGGQGSLYPPMPYRPELHSQGTPSPPPPSSPNASELYAQGIPPQHRPELQGQGAMYPTSPSNASELYGQGTPPPHRPELQGQGAMYPTSPSNASELYGQGTPPPNRPELQGQGAMYPTQPQHHSELQGQGTQFHNANPNRPELAGQYGYPMQQHPQHQHPPYPGGAPPQQAYQPYPMYNPGAPPPPSPGGGHVMYGQQPGPPPPQEQQQQGAWQPGPVPVFHEMEGAHHAR